MYMWALCCAVLTRPWGSACSSYSTCMEPETDTCTKKYVTIHVHIPPFKRPLLQYLLLHPIPAFYILQYVIYGAVSMSKQAKSNCPGESPQMHTASSPQCHTHSSASQHCTKLKPQTLTVSMVDGCAWPPTLNMEMLWKQNLNIYIRWLWKRGYVLLFILPPHCMYFLCSGWGDEAEKGRKRETGLGRVERHNLLKRLKLYINR